jgi:LytS/YehU family sensor histidine kinase
MKPTKPLAAALAELDAYLLRQEKQRFTGRLQITVDLQEGGIRRVRVDQLTKIDEREGK